MSEPEWMKKISNESMCTYYYALFIAACVFAGLSLLNMVLVIPLMRLPKGVVIAATLLNLLVLGLAVVNAMFLYMLCDRALVARR